MKASDRVKDLLAVLKVLLFLIGPIIAILLSLFWGYWFPISKATLLSRFEREQGQFESAVLTLTSVRIEYELSRYRVCKDTGGPHYLTVSGEVGVDMREAEAGEDMRKTVEVATKPLFQALPVHDIRVEEQGVWFRFDNEQSIVYAMQDLPYEYAEVDRKQIAENWYYMRWDTDSFDSIPG